VAATECLPVSRRVLLMTWTPLGRAGEGQHGLWASGFLEQARPWRDRGIRPLDFGGNPGFG
jgi:hypothetical protein